MKNKKLSIMKKNLKLVQCIKSSIKFNIIIVLQKCGSLSYCKQYQKYYMILLL